MGVGVLLLEMRRRLMSAAAADETIVGDGRSRLRFIGVVDVELSQQVFVVDGWALSRIIQGSRFLQLQQIVIAASGWMKSWRPTAGHDDGGGQTPSKRWNAPGALIGGRRGRGDVGARAR